MKEKSQKQCAVCGNDMTYDMFVAKTQSDIERVGWTVIGVYDAEIPWVYTIGLTNYGHPELILSGLETEVSAIIINIIGNEIKAGRKFSNGEVAKGFLGGGYELLFKEIILHGRR